MLDKSFQPHDGDDRTIETAAALPVDSQSRPIKAEVNLLRLPLFALQTSGLRTLDGFEYRGSVLRQGERQEYVWRVTRHATRPFPGPLARAAHLAFLSILTERGVPFTNPVTWTWHDLCRRIGITYSGRTVEHLKQAIRATHGLLIESSGAIYSKTAGQLIQLAEDDRSLYSHVRFFSKRRADGEMADENGVWLARWYLDSFNALYTAPLDHELWRHLDRRSPIASRLYEFLLPVFYSPAPFLRINYPYLAQSLPVRVERYFSDAKKQIGPALKLLRDARVASRVDWSPRKTGVAQLLFYRGARLDAPRDKLALHAQTDDIVADELVVKELRSAKTPEADLVVRFYRLWAADELHRPTAKELAQAKEIIALYGLSKARAMIPVVVKELKQHWPDAKTFSAVVTYLPQAMKQFEASQRDRQRREREQQRLREVARQQNSALASRQVFVNRWTPTWEKLSPQERQGIEQSVLAKKSWLLHMPSRLVHECLVELERQSVSGQNSAADQSPPANGAQG